MWLFYLFNRLFREFFERDKAEHGQNNEGQRVQRENWETVFDAPKTSSGRAALLRFEDWEAFYDFLVGTDVLGGPIRKRLGQVKNITLVEQTLRKPIADPAAARSSEHLRFCLLHFAALPRNIRPAKVRLGRSATSLRMTHSGVLRKSNIV